MNPLFKKIVLTAALGLTFFGGLATAKADDRYWRRHWGWYDNTYRPYYHQHYYSSPNYGGNYQSNYGGNYQPYYGGYSYTAPGYNYQPNYGYYGNGGYYQGGGGSVNVGPLQLGWW